jgi:hypothetical protein
LANPDTDSRLVVVTIRTLTLLLSEAVIDRKEQVMERGYTDLL